MSFVSESNAEWLVHQVNSLIVSYNMRQASAETMEEREVLQDVIKDLYCLRKDVEECFKSRGD